MRWTARLRSLLRSLFRCRQAEADLDNELQYHLEQEIESNIRAGMSPDEAKFAAQRLTGSVSLFKEECRDARGGISIENFLRDLRYGLRVLLKDRVFFAMASVTLALGIGVATTLFSVVESQLWRSLPFPEAKRLVTVWERNLKQKWQQAPVSAPEFADYRQRARTFESLAAMQWSTRRNFVAQGLTERPEVAAISAGFFEILRVAPQVGRTFELASEQPGKQTEAIVSAELSRRAFGSPRAALRKTIKLDGTRYSITGVLPDHFRLEVLQTPEVFLPLEVSGAESRHSRDLVVIGRLRAGVTLRRALGDMEAVARGIAIEHPDTNANFSVSVSDLGDTFTSASAHSLLLLSFAFSVFVLLIACANVAGLQLMRSVVRQREFAVREALGASRATLVRQALAESAWIAFSGAALGILLATWSIHALRSLPLRDMLLRETELSLDLWSVAFAVAISIGATFLFGLAPRFSASKGNVEAALRDSGRGISSSIGTRRRIGFLAVAEVTLAFLSLFGAGLFVASNSELQHIPLGFNPHDVLTMQIPLSGAKYSDRMQLRKFYRGVIEQASAIAGVRELALSSSLPLTGGDDTTFVRAGYPRPAHGQEPSSLERIITPDYFHLLGIPIVQGRAFTGRDSEASPGVAIINVNFARHFFSGENPIGKQLLILRGTATAVPEGKVEIVGVAANARDVGLDEVPFDDLYFPFAQNQARQMYAITKTSAPLSVAPVLRRKFQHLDAEQFVANAKPLDSYVNEAMQSPRFNLLLISIFAVLALILTAVALYGTLSFAAAQRTREIGVRIALGAQRNGVLGLMLRHVLRLTIAGSICGLAIALVLGTMFGSALYMVPHEHEGILYGVGIHDPLSVACAAAVLLLFAVMAGLVPALRATRIDPARVLREQ